MGAWIEMSAEGSCKKEKTGSHPTWVRGLKYPEAYVTFIRNLSHPTWVRGLKSLEQVLKLIEEGSHPTWVRGLKYFPAQRYI